MSRAPQSPVTQIAGALHRHAMRLLAIWLRWARHGEWIRDDVRYGLGVDVNELSLLLRRLEPLGPETLPGEEDDTPQRAWRELCDELEFLRRQDDAVAQRWLDARSRLGLSEAELQLLALLVASSSEHALSRAFRYAWADFRRASMPLGFAVRLLSGTGELGEGRSAELAAKVLPSSSGLYAHQLLSRVREQTDTPLSELGLLAEDDTIALLLGHALSIEGYATPAQLEAPPQRSEQLMTRVLESLPAARAENARCWLIHGPSGSGRSALAGQLARALCNGGVMQLDLGAAVESGLAEARIRRAIRCASLLDACLVISGVERLSKEQRQRWVEVVEERLQSTRLLWIWIADEPMPELRIRPAGLVPIAYPSRAERLHVWREALRDRMASIPSPTAQHDEKRSPPAHQNLDGALLEQLAGRFLLTEGQIAHTVREAFSRAEFNSGKDNIVSLLETVARRESAIGLGRLATPETKRVELSQLVVDEATRDLLHEIISYTQHRDRLAHEWGFERAMPYGLGVTALFTGPPGTGKTMAANAIASALGLELYRVDLSQMVSKYIGETEKHLSTVFSAAENGEVMLLFDEADSLFSKRTEVKTSVDRYANLEVNYLLQRMERFDGVVVLTTNFEAGIDDAFARRIRFRVAFPEPDVKHRFRLWRMLMPADVPLAEDVDFRTLAEDYELSGGHIKEIVLRAAALAMGDGASEQVSQELLIRSAEAEYRKLGKLVMTQ